ncbi:acyltransferase [Alloalcanivorax sp. C16-1]|uniref:acyltransferase n=1 Tax=Alloalcanivorax sp. C16-1 TaxID=3390051 RepID=UPI0039709C62
MFIRILSAFFRRMYRWARVWKFNILSTNKYFGDAPQKKQPTFLSGQGKIFFGKGVKIGVTTSPKFWSSECYIEARSKESEVNVGENTWINNGFSAISHKDSIKIGGWCLIGHDVFIVDSDFHCVDPASRHSGGAVDSGAVYIGDNVFIGSKVTILKKSMIGDGSVVAAGSVVSGKFPPNSLIAGNPAKLVRTV